MGKVREFLKKAILPYSIILFLVSGTIEIIGLISPAIVQNWVYVVLWIAGTPLLIYLVVIFCKDAKKRKSQ